MRRVLLAGVGASLLLTTPAAAAETSRSPLEHTWSADDNDAPAGPFGVGSEAAAGWPAAQRAPRVSRSAATPRGTTRAPARAVAYLLELAEARAGGYWSQCLKLADDAYMPKGPRVQTAFAQWHRAKAAGVAHPKDPDPPLGAQMFWDPGHSSGHIATYVGDGRAVTNMPDGSVKALKWRQMNDWGPYLGWAEPYYK